MEASIESSTPAGPSGIPEGNSITTKYSVPLLSTVEQRTVGGGLMYKGTEVNVVAFKAGLIYGVDVSLNVNLPSYMSVAPERNTIVSESTQIRIWVPALKK